MESPSSRLRKLSRSGGGEDVREVGGGGDVESLDNKSAVVQNSGSEEGEEVIGRRRGMVEEMNLQGKLRGLLQGLTGTAGKELLSGYSVAEDDDDEESSGSEGSGTRGGLDRSLGGRKTVFPRKVVLKRHSGEFCIECFHHFHLIFTYLISVSTDTVRRLGYRCLGSVVPCCSLAKKFILMW